jgi:hypothetical protein
VRHKDVNDVISQLRIVVKRTFYVDAVVSERDGERVD